MVSTFDLDVEWCNDNTTSTPRVRQLLFWDRIADSGLPEHANRRKVVLGISESFDGAHSPKGNGAGDSSAQLEVSSYEDEMFGKLERNGQTKKSSMGGEG